MNTVSFDRSAGQRIEALHSQFSSFSRLWIWPRKIYKSLLVLGAEILLAAASYILAVAALSESRGLAGTEEVIRATLGLLIALRLAALVSARLYRRSLRYASVPDFISIVKAVSISSLLFWVVVRWQFAYLKVPAAVFLIDAAFLQIFWGGLHFGARVFRTQQAVWRTNGKRVLVVGAGDAGMMVLKDLALDASSPWRPVAVVDDDSTKWGNTIHGVPVVGGTKDLARLAAAKCAEEILICIPSASRSQMHNIFAACRESGIPVRTLPALAELIGGKVSRRDLRNPRVEDLLQRDEIYVDVEETRKIVGGRVVLVTGAGGSIGAELCRQIAGGGPRKLLLLDKSENGLFYVNLEATEILGADRVKPLLVDLLDREHLHEILQGERPEIIFHAAAHKHVGLLELHPQQAIRNNVLGTRNIGEEAIECGAQRFVNISTDKAVHPRNYMGLSKKITELCVQELARLNGTRFMNVRFGNVAGSAGSVLRLFWDQIQKGGPIRISDRRATRYFMSAPEAVHLILRAAALGKGGETFVFDMGEPLNIYELAKTMTLFAGLKPERDLIFEFTGLGDAEKITEELWEEWERPVPTETSRILVTQANPLSRGILDKIRRMESFIARGDREGLLEYVHEIAPEFGAVRRASVPHNTLPRESVGRTWGAGVA
jgi:FlaA1/EpsC-like NDP-sugar epimerase